MLPIFRKRKDKLKPYLESLTKDYLFTEISDEFLTAADLSFMKGVPFPIKNQDLKSFVDKGLSTTKLADNMAVVIGVDISFKYVDQYLQYLHKLFDEKLILVFAGKGEEALKKGDYRLGIAYLRAAMMFKDDALQSMFSYANGCRFWYLSMEGEDGVDELITILKSESQAYFEHCTSAYPEFAMSWYYLAYAYLNQGQYLKSQLAFQHFLSAADETQQAEEIKEAKERIADLDDPVKIEKGVGLMAAGRLEEGLSILETYVNTQYGKWWPLHFNMACAYRQLGQPQLAIEGFLKVLSLNPSNYDAMIALYELYGEAGDSEKAEKYLNKAKIVSRNTEQDAETETSK